jgi:hypothetical protein
MPTPNTQAIQIANTLVSNANSLMNIYNSQVVLDAAWSSDSTATYLAAMTTAPLISDGTQSVTADGSPNSAHPIMGSAYPLLQRPLTSVQIGQLKTILDSVVTLVNGSAVSAQTGALGILNFAVGG